MDSTNSTDVQVLNITVDRIAVAELPQRLRAMLNDRSFGAKHIVTYNPEYAMAARKDPSFLQALQSADLVTADGVGIVVAARLHRNTPAIERITGVDLLGDLAQVSGESGAGLYLLGAGPEVAPKAASALKTRYPQANICGWWWDGSPDPSHDIDSLGRIQESGARILAVAYGAPGQIHWIDRNLDALSSIGIRIVVGVGGALDYWAGEARRPPRLMQKLGLEWLFRLVREPWRWRRQLVLPHFALLATFEAVKSWLPRRAI